VLRRTARRVLLRERIFNDNQERLRAVLTDPEHPVRWAWSRHGERRRLNEALVRDPRFAHLEVVRLRRPREAKRWVRRIPRA
jgi:hypothetical protein